MPDDACIGAACDLLSDIAMHHKLAPTAFIGWSDFSNPLHLPSMRSLVGGYRNLIGTEKMFMQWMHDRLFGPSFAHTGQSRIVEYLHEGDPEVKHLDSVWWEAIKQWYGQPSDIADTTIWQQKWCVKANGNAGKDAVQCWQQGITGKDTKDFPVVRFFPAGSPTGQDFSGEQSPAQLVHFGKSLSKLDQEERQASTEGTDMGNQVTDYYAAACPHCQQMKPAWQEAITKWGKENEAFDKPLVKWNTKECFDSKWHPGHDYDDCMKEGVRSFPTVRFAKADGDGTEHTVDLTGPRTAEAFIKFAKQNVGIDDSKHEAPAADAASGAASAEGAAQQGDGFKVGELVEGMYQGKAWIQARIATVNDDGTYTVNWVDGDKNDTVKSAAELHRPEVQGDEYEREIAKAGFDYNMVNFYASGGARSKRLGGLYAKAMKKWSEMTDPSDDAMFVAGLKQADNRRGIDYGMKERSDPPFVWFEQRECYDKNWLPGRDHEYCKEHGVHDLPSIRLYKFDEDGGHFAKEGSEFQGDRTIKGLVDFLSKETDWPTIKDNMKRYEQVVLGSDGADIKPHTEPPVVSKLPVGAAGATAVAADLGTVGADGDNFFGYVRSKVKGFVGAKSDQVETATAAGGATAAAIGEKVAAMPLPLLVAGPPPITRWRSAPTRCTRSLARRSSTRSPAGAAFL